MDDEFREDEISLTIVGGQPQRKGRRHEPQGKLEIPVGLEKVLFLAARDPEFRVRLLADRAKAIAGLGVQLRPSEKAMLEVAPSAALETMIARIVPANPRRRRFMNLVAAAATSLAAGTAAMGCDTQDSIKMGGMSDVDTDTDADAGQDASAGTDSDTVDTDTDTYAGGGALTDLSFEDLEKK
jgi:hypothetical protein